MARFTLAWRAFWRVWRDAEAAARVERALAGSLDPANSTAAIAATTAPQAKPPPVKVGPQRSEALTLLATLQREARLVDFLMEPLDEFSDEQIGAAARDVHRNSRAALTRIFACRPLVAEEDGSRVELPSGYDAARFRLTGKVGGQAPFLGVLGHHGWEATRCDLPVWTGGESGLRVIAPAEVEI